MGPKRARGKGAPPAAGGRTETAVWITHKDAQACAGCRRPLRPGDLVHLTPGVGPRCLACAGLADLTYLPSGDAALTRRASAGSPRVAVVLQYSRTRKRNERQGILVEAAALQAAQEACAADAGQRAQRRETDGVRAERVDARHLAQFARRIRELFPGCPADEVAAIARRSCARGSGRVGRTRAAKRGRADAVTLAVRAHLRHVHTDYDGRLAAGADPREARDEVQAQVDALERRWRAP
jgi:hypothetical protein